MGLDTKSLQDKNIYSLSDLGGQKKVKFKRIKLAIKYLFKLYIYASSFYFTYNYFF